MVRYGAEPLSRSTRAPVPASLPRHSAQTPSGGAGGGGGSGSASPASSMGEDTAELALSSLPHGYESDADFDDLRTRLMASEEREGRLKSEVAALRSSHGALQAQVKMALLSEASDEGERSRQVENLETSLHHERGVRLGLDASMAELLTTVHELRAERETTRAEMDTVFAAKAEAKALRERNAEMQQQWNDTAAAARRSRSKATDGAGSNAKDGGNEAGNDDVDSAHADAGLWEELAEAQRVMTYQAAKLEKATSTMLQVRGKLTTAEGEIESLRRRSGVLQAELKEQKVMERLAIDRVEEVVKERDDRTIQFRGAQTLLDNLRKVHVTLSNEVEGDNGMRAQLRSVTCEAKDMLRQMSEEGDVRYQLAVKSKEVMDQRLQLGKLDTELQALSEQSAEHVALTAFAAELSECNAQLVREVAALRGDLSRLSAAHGADAVEEAKAFAMRHAEDAKRLRVTVREQMELLTFQVEKADIKDKVAVELKRAGEKKDAEILALRLKLGEAQKLEGLSLLAGGSGGGGRAGGGGGGGGSVGSKPATIGGGSTPSYWGGATGAGSVGAVVAVAADEDAPPLSFVQRQFEWNQKLLKRRL
uniref:Uncharacterized protein n=1 Tax=Mantoniella antarctica TaxID=81844 RepID=A0A7S0SIL8_9CHLO|mmetsp:Transcript_26323/g.65942  ORF Transcript_26323/g.65942 Transcript_26323/m.65942 type:complete len:593 (+) Transcript_26323:146-1924(+)